jgi:hypothetical protein
MQRSCRAGSAICSDQGIRCSRLARTSSARNGARSPHSGARTSSRARPAAWARRGHSGSYATSWIDSSRSMAVVELGDILSGSRRVWARCQDPFIAKEVPQRELWSSPRSALGARNGSTGFSGNPIFVLRRGTVRRPPPRWTLSPRIGSIPSGPSAFGRAAPGHVAIVSALRGSGARFRRGRVCRRERGTAGLESFRAAINEWWSGGK